MLSFNDLTERTLSGIVIVIGVLSVAGASIGATLWAGGSSVAGGVLIIPIVGAACAGAKCSAVAIANPNPPPNWLKWYEYGVSATLGTLAALASGGSLPAAYAIGLVAAGSLQQRIGSLIDGLGTGTADSDWCLWGVAWALQMFEFLVVWNNGINAGVGAVYTVSWSAFGVLATVQLCGPVTPDATASYEAWYSFLSWVAKLSVLGAIYTGKSLEIAIGGAAAIALMVALSVAAVLRV